MMFLKVPGAQGVQKVPFPVKPVLHMQLTVLDVELGTHGFTIVALAWHLVHDTQDPGPSKTLNVPNPQGEHETPEPV